MDSKENFETEKKAAESADLDRIVTACTYLMVGVFIGHLIASLSVRLRRDDAFQDNFFENPATKSD